MKITAVILPGFLLGNPSLEAQEPSPPSVEFFQTRFQFQF
jgi:hypothetical protein